MHPEVRVLMLSMHDNEQYLFEALKAGASGYVLKTAADRDLVEACRAALRGEPFLYPSAVAALIRDFLERARTGETVPEEPLTPRELEVVKLVAEAHTSARDRPAAAHQSQDGRAPPRERDGQARHARPRRADALRDPPRARRALAPPWGRDPRGVRGLRARPWQATGAARTTLAGCRALVILWTRPSHLKREEADAWVRLRSCCTRDRLTPGLRRSSPPRSEHPVSWQWMLELELEDAPRRRRARCAAGRSRTGCATCGCSACARRSCSSATTPCPRSRHDLPDPRLRRARWRSSPASASTARRSR